MWGAEKSLTNRVFLRSLSSPIHFHRGRRATPREVVACKAMRPDGNCLMGQPGRRSGYPESCRMQHERPGFTSWSRSLAVDTIVMVVVAYTTVGTICMRSMSGTYDSRVRKPWKIITEDRQELRAVTHSYIVVPT